MSHPVFISYARTTSRQYAYLAGDLPCFTRRAFAEYVSTEKCRPAFALARRSAPARRREAAPSKAGNAAGGFFQQTRSGTGEYLTTLTKISSRQLNPYFPANHRLKFNHLMANIQPCTVVTLSRS
jgi:hypothetical protein